MFAISTHSFSNSILKHIVHDIQFNDASYIVRECSHIPKVFQEMTIQMIGCTRVLHRISCIVEEQLYEQKYTHRKNNG